MYVCLCNAVTDTEIEEAIAEGFDDLDSIIMKLGAGACCGSCIYTVKSILDDHHDEKTNVSAVSIYRP